MIGTTKRLAGFPGERFTFEVSPGADPATQVVTWAGGGDPATGTGRTFSTVFRSGGTHTVTAISEEDEVRFEVTVCPIDEWLIRAQQFYGHSVDFSRVRVGASRLVLGPSGTAWTCNDVIRFKRAKAAKDLPSESTLIHELGHVWEHQTGQAQLLRGIIEQIGRRFGRDPYDYGGPEGLRRATALTSFTKEGQAQILTELWKSKHGQQKSDRKGVPFSTPGYVEALERLVTGAGIGSSREIRRGPFTVLDASIARIVNLVMGRVG
jgi:Domain of unknown function (DUF4157)